MTGNLVLNLAHRRVRAYSEETDRLIGDHHEAMHCRDCEDFLQNGIDTLLRIRRAEETLREADYEGIFAFDAATRSAVGALYRTWLQPCEFAETWIAELREMGHVPDNLDEFRAACEFAKDAVAQVDWQERATRARALTSSEEPW
jgi:hypothetical protein